MKGVNEQGMIEKWPRSVRVRVLSKGCEQRVESIATPRAFPGRDVVQQAAMACRGPGEQRRRIRRPFTGSLEEALRQGAESGHDGIPVCVSEGMHDRCTVSPHGRRI